MSLSGGPLPGSGADGKVRPYWPVALALFGVAAVLLVSGFLYIRQSRASVGVASQPATSVVAVAAQVSPVPSIANQPSAPASVAAAAPSATASDPLAQEVADAYQRYWQVYSDAMLQLDSSLLPQVTAGAALKDNQDEIAGLQARKRAVRVVVEHHFFVFNVTATDARVYDEVHNQSYLVDPVTKQAPQSSQQVDIEKDTFQLSKLDGSWKVTTSTRQRASQ